MSERDRLAALRLESVEQPAGEVGHRGKIALADRAERAELWQPVGVQSRDDELRELRTGHGRALGERVCEPERRRADDVMRRGRSLRDQVVLHEQPLVTRGFDPRVLAHADPGREAVRLVAAARAQPAATSRARRMAVARLGREGHGLGLARNRHDVLERERATVEDDGHAALIAERRH